MNQKLTEVSREFELIPCDNCSHNLNISKNPFYGLYLKPEEVSKLCAEIEAKFELIEK